jgi:hypothetical protein
VSKIAFLGRSWSRRSRRAKGEPTQYPQIFLDLPIDLLRPPTEMPRWTPTSVRTWKQTEDKTKKLVPEAWNHVRRVISHQRQNKVRHNICVDVHLAMLLLSIVCNSIMLHMGHGQYLIYEYFQVIIFEECIIAFNSLFQVLGNHVRIPRIFHCILMVFQQVMGYFLALSNAAQSS